MSYSNNVQRQSPGDGRSGGRANTPYAPLSQPQTNSYPNYHPTNPDNHLGVYPSVETEPWPYTTPEYGWASGAPALPSEGYATAGYPPYPLQSSTPSYNPPALYPNPYAYTSTDEHWSNDFNGNYDLTPSPPPPTLNPQVLQQQNQPTQTASKRTRRSHNSTTTPVASSSVATPNPNSDPPSYRIVSKNGKNILECLCGCRRTYGRYNEWARAHGYTETECEICGSIQSRRDSLLRHLRDQHNIHSSRRPKD
ncbi:unnamed protein product [Rhizoctonia solani]|uniref:C2H2-type domain-containing protein n=1 Tax=Rhizoctonia solani TaxID=456999 RepID=A0A8H3CWG8_9AGAM|nr:unnamed protein product [Rhizoctonia solani]